MDSHDDSIALEKRIGVNFPLLRDPDLTVTSAYGVAMKGEDMAVPAVFVIRSDGTISWRYIGERMWDRPLWKVVLDEAHRAHRVGEQRSSG